MSNRSFRLKDRKNPLAGTKAERELALLEAGLPQARLEDIYNKLHHQGWSLEDIQTFIPKKWADLDVLLGLGLRLRGRMKVFLKNRVETLQNEAQFESAQALLALLNVCTQKEVESL
ncbi:hypothetical protein MMC14_010454 [Varicellaria rhodocarpa]|nr:hypothetical protein [Varicellaria rhodocarpa]